MVSGSCSTLAEETWSLVVAPLVILAVFGFVAAVATGLAVGSVGSYRSGCPASPSKTPTR